MKFGTYLHMARNLKELSQRELCKRSGVSNSVVSRIESGEDTTLSTAMKLADGLGVPLWRIIRQMEANRIR